MRITNKDPRHCIDREALIRCMRKMGFEEQEIKNVYFTVYPYASLKERKKQIKRMVMTLGYFDGGRCISIYTYMETLSSNNNSVVHELSHYLDTCRAARKLCQAFESEPEECFKLLKEVNDERDQDNEGEYENRPCEVRARAYAQELAPRYRVIRRVRRS